MSTFRTLPSLIQRPTLYALVLCGPDPAGTPIESYTFPLSPSDIHKGAVALNPISYVAGTAAQLGVQPIVDQFGQTPPVYTIRGTTGSKYHSADGFIWDGLTSLQALEEICAQFAQLNQQQMQSNQPNLYSLEFYDYFMNDFWQVVPIGPQSVDQSSQAPILGFYSLTLAAVRPLTFGPPADADSTDDTLNQGAQQTTDQTATYCDDTLNTYLA